MKKEVKDVQPQQRTLPIDMVALPSEGLFYKNRTSVLEVEYMTGMDEDLLSNQNLIEEDQVWKIIYENKVKTVDKVPFEDLLWCDLLAFMIHIRVNTYGETYETKLIDPKTKNEFNHNFDLTNISFSWDKKNDLSMDENGFINFKTSSGKKFKLRVLSSEKKKEIKKTAQQQKSMGMNTSENIEILKNSIVEVEGKTAIDKNAFLEGIEFTGRDSLEIKKFIGEITPRVNLEQEVTSPSGQKFKTMIPINVSFFFPALFI